MPDFDQIFRTYTSQEPQKSLEEMIKEVWKKDADAQKIKEYVEESKKKFDFSNEKTLYENIPHFKAEEVLEKYVILNHLIDNKERLFLQNGQNPFKRSIFSKLFERYSTDQLLEKFMRLNREYALALHEFQNEEIKRVSVYDQMQGRKKIISCKSIDAMNYEKLDSESMKQLEHRKKNFEYKFKIGVLQEMKQAMLASKMLLFQMLINIQERMKQGWFRSSVTYFF